MTLKSKNNPALARIMHNFPFLTYYDNALRANILNLMPLENDFFYKFTCLIYRPDRNENLRKNVYNSVFRNSSSNEVLANHALSDLQLLITQMFSLKNATPSRDRLTRVSIDNDGIDMVVPVQVNSEVGVVFFIGQNSGYLFALTSNRGSDELNNTLHIFESDSVKDLEQLNALLVSEYFNDSPNPLGYGKRISKIEV